MNRRASFPRIAWLATLLAGALGLVAGRVAWLSLAEQEQGILAFDIGEIPPQRGTIWDRDGALLATETYDRYEIVLDREAAADTTALAIELAPILGEDPASLGARLEAGGRWQVLDSVALPETADAIDALEHPALAAKRNPSRHYPARDLTGHLTGFVDLEGQGHYGLEGQYDSLLRGMPGRRPGIYRTDPRAFVMPADGSDLVLTIDLDLQVVAMEVLREAVRHENATAGTLVALDPVTGELLASASWPTYDPNRYQAYDFDRYNDPAVRGSYPPGSVIKPLTLAAAIDAGLLAPESTYEDTDSVRFGGILVPNPDRFGHGLTTMTDMLRLSLNVGAVHVARTLGRDRFYIALDSFGFGRATGIDLSGELDGLVHWPEDGVWTEEIFAFNAYGQALDATPLQVTAAMATLANDGWQLRPRVVGATVPPFGAPVPLPADEPVAVVSPTTARAVRRMMTRVVQDRVTQAAVPGFEVAGKTGTSEIPGAPGEDKDLIASFCGMLPADEPQLVVCVKIDRPEGGRGSRVAAPVFRAFAEQAVVILDIPPDDPEAWAEGRIAAAAAEAEQATERDRSDREESP
jgi:cell division protein FtsI/penicillin-binding protein 2